MDAELLTREQVRRKEQNLMDQSDEELAKLISDLEQK